MAALYFLILAVLVVGSYILGRSRASVVASGAGNRPGAMHSLPNYHGLLAASAALIPMLAVYVVGAPTIQRIVEAGALSLFPAEVLNDPLQRGAALRDIQNLATGQYSGASSTTLAAAAAYFQSATTRYQWVLLAAGVLLSVAAVALSLARISPSFRARNTFERIVLSVLIVCAAVAILTTI